MSSVKDPQPQQGDPAGRRRKPSSRRARRLRCGARLRAQLFSSTSPLWIFLALVVIVAVFGIMKPSSFLSSFDIKTIFINASVALMLSVGMTYVIITAGIDLSVGSVLVFSGRARRQSDDRRRAAARTTRDHRRLGSDSRRGRGRAAGRAGLGRDQRGAGRDARTSRR